MTREHLKAKLRGCYVTVPTMFRDPDLDLNLDAMRRHVRFLLAGGLREGNAVLLAGGAAGDFSTMSFDERMQVAETVIAAADGQLPVAVGVQTTNTRELIELAAGAQRLGASFMQVSPPFYHAHTESDFLEYVAAASNAAPDVGVIVYNTYWTSRGVSSSMIERLLDLPNMVGLKWATPDRGQMEFESVVAHFADQLAVIDNQCRFVVSHLLGACSIEVHICNHWPQWGVRVFRMLEERRYQEVQSELMKVVVPYMQLWAEMEQFTSGDGYLDKLCMELVGLDSSRCRPPTQDVRERFREQARQMLIDTGTPGVK
ncbi:MAG: dihydrodipicolinate synthase family protein [Pirellulaceae bacterium]|jgi:dihydrodipicolinate synthase/N-acetylneuraminate lyase|nr:dihydrodipicolinate synthase family protein [Pirellulaceae bacterium]MDP7016553.1 dihydrodipicolinate synthase family protein [Pirellulaceae bacterium]